MGDDVLSQFLECLKETGLKVGVIRQATRNQLEPVHDLLHKALTMQWIWDLATATAGSTHQSPAIKLGAVLHPKSIEAIPEESVNEVNATQVEYYLTSQGGIFQVHLDPTSGHLVEKFVDVSELVRALSRNPDSSALEQVRTNILLAIKASSSTLEQYGKELTAMVEAVTPKAKAS